MYKVTKTYVCRGCNNPANGTGQASADIGVNANLELMDKFCYFGDMLSVDVDADAAVGTRFRIGWKKNSGSWCHCLSIRIDRMKRIPDCTNTSNTDTSDLHQYLYHTT